jgi:hypothetical protein
VHCQWSKIHRHTRLLPQPIPIPQQWFAHLHIDLVGPLQCSNGCNHIFTIIDCTSKWMEAIPLLKLPRRRVHMLFYSFFLDKPFWGARNDHF